MGAGLGSLERKAWGKATDLPTSPYHVKISGGAGQAEAMNKRYTEANKPGSHGLAERQKDSRITPRTFQLPRRRDPKNPQKH